jgi:DNA-binding response OmpR family regulator
MNSRVLIVDDEPDFLNLLAFNLAEQGFEVICASNGLEGLHRARCEGPGVIILDFLLPDLDGLAVCGILRAQPSTRDVPIIMLSALEAPPTGPCPARLRVTRWLTKGAGLGSLNDCVRTAIANHQEHLSARMSQDD